MRAAPFAATLVVALSAAAEAPVVTVLGDRSMPPTAAAAAGIWEFRPGGAIVTIEPLPGNRLTMTVLDSPDYTVAPGDGVALLEATAEPGTYDMRLYESSEALSGQTGGRRTRDAEVTVDAVGRRLSFRHFSRRRSLSFRRWIAALVHARPANADRPPLDGAVRLWPEPYHDPMPL